MNSAASRADSHLPPACADHGSAYQTAMHDWMVGASDAKDGNLLGTSSRIASGAHVIDAVTVLQRLSPTLLKGLSRPVAIPVESSAPATPRPPSRRRLRRLRPLWLRPLSPQPLHPAAPRPRAATR